MLALVMVLLAGGGLLSLGVWLVRAWRWYASHRMIIRVVPPSAFYPQGYQLITRFTGTLDERMVPLWATLLTATCFVEVAPSKWEIYRRAS